MKNRYPLLSQRLRAFNAKERFLLVSHILGNENFNPGPEFWTELKQTLNIHANHFDVYGAMDFHLDWLYAALACPELDSKNMSKPGITRDRQAAYLGTVKGSQEDIDFVLTFSTLADGKRVEHLVLIEAKGVGYFTNVQMSSKYKRLQAILGAACAPHEELKIYLVLMSPRGVGKGLGAMPLPLQKILGTEKPFVMHLPMPQPQAMLKVSCSLESGTESKDGAFWVVTPRR